MGNFADTYKTIPEMEDEIIRFWKKHDIFKKSVEKNTDGDSYVFYDGPPFISGLPHYGHLLGSVAKDVIPRYWTMKGKKVERVWGWDAHGLTVENKVQARLGIKNRKGIEDFGLEKFTQESYKYISEITNEWKWYIDKIGRWVDMENAYKTIDQTYMESVIWVFNQLYDKGLIYEGVRTSLFCTTCGTPVSNFEIAMDNSYKEVEDPAITVKFPVTSAGKYKGVNLLAWTTTPWTIPSNRALVVDKNETYVLVESGGEKFVTAKKRVDDVFSGLEYRRLSELSGVHLLDLEYEPPFGFFTSKKGEFRVYHYEGMVNMVEGTGIVHSAPGFGEIDTEMGRYYELTLMLVVDDEGKFLPGTAGENPYEGMFYPKANDLIRNDLKSRNLLFKDERAVHRVPYHDRCNTILIQKAQNSWFVDIQKLKPELIKNNEYINWVPGHLKEGRFLHNIQQAPDWCISRNRFWATPMPVWESEDGDRIVISSIKQLEELSGRKVKDLHRPYIDEITIERNGKKYIRRTEVLDSWMEAGSMPYAQIHYPFENEEKFENSFPGDFIVEYIGQVRAWFFFMHVLSTALMGSHSFKNVISTGVMAGSDGRKMSKTYGNYTDPKTVLLTYGGDALRLYLMASPLMTGENANFDETELRNKLRNVLNPLWNSLKFFVMYADTNDWKVGKIVPSNNLLDKWILARLNEVTRDISTNIEDYLIPPAVRALEEFVDELSRWYIRRSRDRISAGDGEALSTLYIVLDILSKSAAPLIPFMSEGIYRELKRFGEGKRSESVHLEEFPVFDPMIINDNVELINEMKVVREIVSLGHSIRTLNGISVRQPLGMLEVKGVKNLKEEFTGLIKDELNVKGIMFVKTFSIGDEWKAQKQKDIGVAVNTKVTDELKTEGNARSMIRTFQELRKDLGYTVGERVKKAQYLKTPENMGTAKIYGEEIKSKIFADELVPGDSYEINKKS